MKNNKKEKLNLAKTLPKWILSHQITVFIVSALITISALFLIPSLKVDTDFLHFLPQDHRDVVFFNDVGETFGSNYMAMIAVQSDDIFEHNVLSNIRKLTRSIKEIDGISDVISITNIMDIKKLEDGIEVGDLISKREIPKDKEVLKNLKKYALAKDIFNTTVISKDGKTAAILIQLASDAPKDVVAAKIRSKTINVKGISVYYAGFPLVMNSMSEIIKNDMGILVPLIIIVVCGILLFTFRRFMGVVLPLGNVLLATIWTLGIMSLTGIPITMLSSMMIVILISTGTAYGIHMMTAVYHEYEKVSEDKKISALLTAFNKVGVAIFLAGVTTFIGFFALQTSSMKLFAEFGLFSSIGIICALLISLTLIPAILSKVKIGKKIVHTETKKQSLLDKIMIWTANFVISHKILIIILSTISVITMALALPKLRQRWIYSLTSQKIANQELRNA